MECELCSSHYEKESTNPKVYPVCSHTYCENCLCAQYKDLGFSYCPVCKDNTTSLTTQDPTEFPINDQLLKVIDFRKSEKQVLKLIKNYEIRNPKFFPKIAENVTRAYKPYEIVLNQVTADELVYYEKVVDNWLDKRQLGVNQHTYRKYSFNVNSIFMMYLMLSPQTRFLFMFRKFHGCQHKHSCLENVVRKLYSAASFYLMIRLPISYYLENESTSKTMIIFEALCVAALAGFGAAGCLVRYAQEEIISRE